MGSFLEKYTGNVIVIAVETNGIIYYFYKRIMDNSVVLLYMGKSVDFFE